MNQLTIIFKNSNITLPLNFSAYKDADEHRKDVAALIQSPSGTLRVEDSYGTIAELDSNDISGVVLVDLSREFDRQAEYSVMQALSQQKAQKNFQASAGKIIQPINPVPGAAVN